MSVLEQLKKEAQAIEAQRTTQETVRSTMEQQVLNELLPVMRRIHTYFKEFERHLGVVNPDVSVAYEVRGFGPVAGLKQDNYSLTTDRPADPERVQLRFECHREGTIEVPMRDPGSAAEYKAFLKVNGLRGKQRDAGRGASVFVVEARIPVILEFRVDLEREAIALNMRNFNLLGVTRYTLTPDRLDESFLDEVARMVMRQPNDFAELMGNKLTDTGIFRIREQLQTANVSGEVSISPALPSAPSLMQRLRRAFSRG